jgi:GNAT superfamily N-acetyltransferase
MPSLPDRCRACLFWEVADAARGPDTVDPDFAVKSKEAWWQAAELEHPTLSRAVFAGDELVGYALVGEPGVFPRSRRLGPAPSSDALLVGTLWIAPAHRGGGLAKMLLQSVLREAVRRHRQALEVYGQWSGPEEACIASVAALEALGFVVVDDHPRYPLLRLDVRRTVSWAEQAQRALERVLGVLGRRERVPARRPALERFADPRRAWTR